MVRLPAMDRAHTTTCTTEGRNDAARTQTQGQTKDTPPLPWVPPFGYAATALHKIKWMLCLSSSGMDALGYLRFIMMVKIYESWCYGMYVHLLNNIYMYEVICQN